jgi:hypothetical protein
LNLRILPSESTLWQVPMVELLNQNQKDKVLNTQLIWMLVWGILQLQVPSSDVVLGRFLPQSLLEWWKIYFLDQISPRMWTQIRTWNRYGSVISDVDGEDIFQRAHDLVKYERAYFGYFRSTTSPGAYQEHIKACSVPGPALYKHVLCFEGITWFRITWQRGWWQRGWASIGVGTVQTAVLSHVLLQDGYDIVSSSVVLRTAITTVGYRPSGSCPKFS